MTPTPGDRRSRRQAARAEARRAGRERSGAGRWLVPALLVGAIAVAGLLAVVLPGATGPSTGGFSSVPPTGGGGASAAASGSAGAVAPASVSGLPLPQFTGPDGDPAVGQPAPVVAGTDFAGAPVDIEPDGRPKVIVFLAHWCPHCQAAVPVMQTWVSAGGVPSGVDVVSVATGIDPGRPNHPPDAWLAREGWTVPVVVDPDDTVAAAFGLTAYPFWVFVDRDGAVEARAVGEMSIPDLEAMMARIDRPPSG